MNRKHIAVLLICLAVAALPVSALAHEAPFGDSAEPLTAAEMQAVEGEFKTIGLAAAAGSIMSTTSYFVTTPRSRWSFSGAARSALAGAMTGAMGFSLAR